MKKEKFFRMICLMLIVSMGIATVLIGCGKQKGGQQALEMDDSLAEQVTDICGGEKAFYVAAKNDILKYSEEGKLLDSFHFDDRAILSMAYGDALYALDWLNQELIKVDEKGQVTDTLKLEKEFQGIRGLSAYEQILYLSCSVAEEEIRDVVYRVDMETGKIEEFMETFGTVYADRAKDSYILLAGGDIFNGGVDSEGTDFLESYGTPGLKVQSMIKDEKGKELYFVRENRVYRYNNGDPEVLHSLEIKPQKIAAAGKHLLLLEPSQELALVTMTAGENENRVTLTLYNIREGYSEGVGEEARYVDVGAGFKAKENVDLDYRHEGVSAYEAFLTDVMSGNDKYDIYLVSNKMGDSTGYKANHAYFDLSDSQILVDAVSEMYPAVSAAAWNGEELFGLPIEIGGEVLCYNPGTYPEYDAAYYESWENVLDLLGKEDWSKMYMLFGGRVVEGIFDQYLTAYGETQSGDYTFDTPEFKETLRLMKRAAQMELPSSVVSDGRAYGTVLEEDELLGWVDLWEYAINPVFPIAAPSINGEEGKSQVYQMFAVVNPNSKHKEEAVAYLEYICQTGQIQGNPMLYASEKYPEMTAFIEERMVSNFDRRIKATEVYPILWEYLDGEITEEELIDRLTKSVNMQVNE